MTHQCHKAYNDTKTYNDTTKPAVAKLKLLTKTAVVCDKLICCKA